MMRVGADMLRLGLVLRKESLAPYTLQISQSR